MPLSLVSSPDNSDVEIAMDTTNIKDITHHLQANSLPKTLPTLSNNIMSPTPPIPNYSHNDVIISKTSLKSDNLTIQSFPTITTYPLHKNKTTQSKLGSQETNDFLCPSPTNKATLYPINESVSYPDRILPSKGAGLVALIHHSPQIQTTGPTEKKGVTVTLPSSQVQFPRCLNVLIDALPAPNPLVIGENSKKTLISVNSATLHHKRLMGGDSQSIETPPPSSQSIMGHTLPYVSHYAHQQGQRRTDKSDYYNLNSTLRLLKMAQMGPIAVPSKKFLLKTDFRAIAAL